MMFLTRGASAAAAALIAAGALSACGGGDSKSSATTSTASSGADAASPAVAAAKADFAKFHATQPPISVPTLPKKPPAGLRLTITTCPLPVCRAESDPVAEAAKILGWKVKTIQAPYTPEGYQTAWNQLLEDPPDLIAASAVVPDSFIAKQLAVVAKRNIPLVELGPSGDRPTSEGPLKAAVAGVPQFAQDGRLMGSTVVADAGRGPDTVWITDPSVTVFKPAEAAFAKTVGDAGGHADVMKVALANIGKSIPGQVVSYVQSHPKVKYLAFSVADFTVGVPQALKVAGLSDKVKIISRAPQAANLADIKNGSTWAAVAEENTSGGYRAVDQMARLAMGVELGDLRDPAGWAQILTKDNVTQTTVAPSAPGSPAAFLSAWHVD
ncbi:MAG: hypothetical protein JWQ18_3007 [Conexibacter sp.]|nr:hypothetical protein [Conexibacter sp.]